MPSGELALLLYSLLFMFTVFGPMGTLLIGSVNQRLTGSDNELWKTMALTAAVLLPLVAVTISRARAAPVTTRVMLCAVV